jgi:hypothetical protein
MHVFDLAAMTGHSYAEREKTVLFSSDEFKARIIELPPGGEMPTCKMASYVVFFVADGSVTVQVNDETVRLDEKQGLVSEPATLSMKTESGWRQDAWIAGRRALQTQSKPRKCRVAHFRLIPLSIQLLRLPSGCPE